MNLQRAASAWMETGTPPAGLGIWWAPLLMALPAAVLLVTDSLLRRRAPAPDRQTSNCYRLIHGEDDGLSGLIIDKFAEVFVVEPYPAGYIGIMEWIAASLQALYPGSRIVVRPDERIAVKEGVNFSKIARAYSGPDFIEIKEHNLRMVVNLKTGHKTGFFLDQRENRFNLSQYGLGREVLDSFLIRAGLPFLQCWRAQSRLRE